MKTQNSPVLVPAVLFALVMLLSSAAYAGIKLEKDVSWAKMNRRFPKNITFYIYDSNLADTPIASQTFPRGDWVADYNFDQYPAARSGIVKFKVNFTHNAAVIAEALNNGKVLWVELLLDRKWIGAREEIKPEVWSLFSEESNLANEAVHAVSADKAITANNANSVPWSGITGKPEDFADDIDNVGVASGADSKIGSNSINYVPKWNGSALVSGSIFDNGNIGIGVSNTDATLGLKVSAPTGAWAMKWYDTTSQQRGGIWLNDSADGGLYLYDKNGVPAVAIRDENSTFFSNGNFGVGISKPTEKLHVIGNIKASGKIIADEGIVAEHSTTADTATNADTVDGVHASDLEESAEIAKVDSALADHKADTSIHHTRYTDAEARAAADDITAWGHTNTVTNLNADMVDGKHASDLASSDHDHDERYYTKTQINVLITQSSNGDICIGKCQ